MCVNDIISQQAGQTTLRRDLVSPTAGQVGTDRTGLFALDNSFLHLEGLQILNFGNGTQSGPVVKAKASAVEIFSSNFQNNYGMPTVFNPCLQCLLFNVSLSIQKC